MARESMMKPIRVEGDQNTGNGWSSLTVMSDQRMLSSLGSNLRDVYGEVSESAQPSDLLRLAAMIDERLGRPGT